MGYDVKGIHPPTGDMMTDTISCAQCFNTFTVHDESSIMDWRCPVCDGNDYFLADTDDLSNWGYHEEDEGRGSDEGDDEKRLREY